MEVQGIECGRVGGMCRVKNMVVSAGRGIRVMGKVEIEGEFTCIKYFEEIEMLCAGDRDGVLHVIRTY